MRFPVIHDPAGVAQWVANRIPGMELEAGSYNAIGVMSDAGELLAGVIYNHYTGHDIAMHVAALRGRLWATPDMLAILFGYPFNQLRCRRVTGFVAANRPAVLAFDKKLGFVEEGRLRDATPAGDMIVLGMTRDECRWIGATHG